MQTQTKLIVCGITLMWLIINLFHISLMAGFLGLGIYTVAHIGYQISNQDWLKTQAMLSWRTYEDRDDDA